MFGMAILKVVRGELTRDPSIIGSADPYVVIRSNAGEVRTSVAKSAGKNPAWSDAFNINLNGDTTICLQVYDKSTLLADHLLGETTINLMGNLQSGQPFASWHPIFLKGSNAGQVFVEILFNGGGERGNLATGSHHTSVPLNVPSSHHMPTNQAQGNQSFSGMATLRVVRAEILKDKSLIGNMDCYTTVRTNASTVETNVAMNQGTTPTWNNSFSINLTGDQIFHICVMDKSLLKDKLVGETTLNLGTALNAGRFAGWTPLYYKGENAGQIYLEVEAGSCTTAPGSGTSGPCLGNKVY